MAHTINPNELLEELHEFYAENLDKAIISAIIHENIDQGEDLIFKYLEEVSGGILFQRNDPTAPLNGNTKQKDAIAPQSHPVPIKQISNHHNYLDAQSSAFNPYRALDSPDVEDNQNGRPSNSSVPANNGQVQNSSSTVISRDQSSKKPFIPMKHSPPSSKRDFPTFSPSSSVFPPPPQPISNLEQAEFIPLPSYLNDLVLKTLPDDNMHNNPRINLDTPKSAYISANDAPSWNIQDDLTQIDRANDEDEVEADDQAVELLCDLFPEIPRHTLISCLIANKNNLAKVANELLAVTPHDDQFDAKQFQAQNTKQRIGISFPSEQEAGEEALGHPSQRDGHDDDEYHEHYVELQEKIAQLMELYPHFDRLDVEYALLNYDLDVDQAANFLLESDDSNVKEFLENEREVYELCEADFPHLPRQPPHADLFRIDESENALASNDHARSGKRNKMKKRHLKISNPGTANAWANPLPKSLNNHIPLTKRQVADISSIKPESSAVPERPKIVLRNPTMSWQALISASSEAYVTNINANRHLLAKCGHQSISFTMFTRDNSWEGLINEAAQSFYCSGDSKVDLHFVPLKVASKFVCAVFDCHQHYGVRSWKITLITGRGAHSRRGVPIIKDHVVNAINIYKYKAYWINSGAVVVTLPRPSS